MKKLVNFIKRDHPYVYLSGAVLGALGIKMASMQPSQLSFLGSSPMLYIPAGICGLFILLALGALAVKLSHWKNFSATAFKSPAMLRLSRYFSYVLWAAVLLLFIDRPLMSFAAMATDSFSAEKMPSDFVPSMLYLLHNGASFFRMGIWTTVRIALLGTLIAFVLALFMVTLRIQKPDRQDNDLVRFLKYIGSRFASIYITVIRGTPMMVQALIFYYAGFNIFKGTGMSVTEINQIWSFFISGLITVSLNSTAYLAEVLRGGIESIDHGQTDQDSDGRVCVGAQVLAAGLQSRRAVLPALPYGRPADRIVRYGGERDEDQTYVQLLDRTGMQEGVDGLQDDEDPRHHDHRPLDGRGYDLDLAVTEGMGAVGGLGGEVECVDPDAGRYDVDY